MSALQDLYKKGGLGYIAELIMKVGNYAWEEMTLFEQGELREKAAQELTSKMVNITTVCEVCFTSSWQPCDEGTASAVKDDSTDGWMVCECCRLGALLSEANLEIASLSEVVQSDHNKAWFDVLLQIVNMPNDTNRDKFISMVKKDIDSKAEHIGVISQSSKYYGIIQEVVETLAKDGRFDRTIVAIRDELGSDLERYTSLEWHLWAEEKPDAKSSILNWHKNGIFSTMFYLETSLTRDFLKWAYLPYTGWTEKE